MKLNIYQIDSNLTNLRKDLDAAIGLLRSAIPPNEVNLHPFWCTGYLVVPKAKSFTGVSITPTDNGYSHRFSNKRGIAFSMEIDTAYKKQVNLSTISYQEGVAGSRLTIYVSSPLEVDTLPKAPLDRLSDVLQYDRIRIDRKVLSYITKSGYNYSTNLSDSWMNGISLQGDVQTPSGPIRRGGTCKGDYSLSGDWGGTVIPFEDGRIELDRVQLLKILRHMDAQDKSLCNRFIPQMALLCRHYSISSDLILVHEVGNARTVAIWEGVRFNLIAKPSYLARVPAIGGIKVLTIPQAEVGAFLTTAILTDITLTQFKSLLGITR